MLNKHRYFSLALAAFILLSSAVSCGKDSNYDNADDDSGTVSNDMTDETDVRDTADDLPEANYDGYVFRILVEDDSKQYIMTDEINGSVVNDAVYTANMNVMGRFNIKLEQIRHNSWTDAVQVRSLILSGEDAFDLGIVHDNMSATLSMEDLFVDLYTVPHLNFEKPWWPEYTVESLTLNGRMYLISNAMTYYGFHSTRCMFFNKDLAENYKWESPYDMVRNGTWTLDNVIIMTKDIYEDLDGNNTADYNDLYGFACTVPYCLLENFGIEALEKSADGKTVALKINNERTVNLLDKMVGWLNSGEIGTYYSSKHSGRYNPDSSNTMFANGNVVLTYGAIGHLLTGLADTHTNYGILPTPKYDEQQENYIGACTEIPGIIPVTATDLDRTGMIVEALSAEGYRHMVPAYYELALKNRYTYDTDSVEMLELMFNNRFLSFSYMYAPTMQQVINNVLGGDTNFASFYASNESAELVNIEKINAFYNKER